MMHIYSSKVWDITLMRIIGVSRRQTRNTSHLAKTFSWVTNMLMRRRIRLSTDSIYEYRFQYYIPYYDANNLYGWAMSEPLPTHGHEWMTDEELTNWQDIPCILEVDLEYPDKLHDLHNDLPLAPEHVMVGEVKKLIPNLNDKTKYVIHYKALKQYISMGLKVTKIHRGVKFEESPWLAKYIEKNTDSRKKATSKSRKIYLS